MKTLENLLMTVILQLEAGLRIVITTRTPDYQTLPIPVAKRILPKKR